MRKAETVTVVPNPKGSLGICCFDTDAHGPRVLLQSKKPAEGGSTVVHSFGAADSKDHIRVGTTNADNLKLYLPDDSEELHRLSDSMRRAAYEVERLRKERAEKEKKQ